MRKLDEWANKWQMQFDKDKCVLMHLGKSNSQFEYMLGNDILKKTVKEKDLGVVSIPV